MDQIGTGKFSKVYKAYLKSNPDKLYAIKQIELNLIAKDELEVIK